VLRDAESVRLDDGAVVDVVTMRPADAEKLVRFHHTLSPETEYLRFFGLHPELSGRELYRFTHVDHWDREAMIAIASDEIVAVARYDRSRAGTDAEVAFIVADRWQGRGLGTLLFTRLARRARAVGVERFTAETLIQNRPMLAVFHRVGLPLRERTERDVVHLEIELGTGDPTPGVV
jgi:GNAT superfamily N-acetyltransferase